METALLSPRPRADPLPPFGDVTYSRPGFEWPAYTIAADAGTAATWLLVSLRVLEQSQHQATPTTAGSSGTRMLLPSADATIASEDILSALELASEVGDEDALAEAADMVDWSVASAADSVRAVQLALAGGAHLLARRLATFGARVHPDSNELAKMARLLAPPRLLGAAPASGSSLRANRAWLRAHGAEYRGKWVALRDGALVGVATTLRELRARVPDAGGTMFTKVF